MKKEKIAGYLVFYLKPVYREFVDEEKYEIKDRPPENPETKELEMKLETKIIPVSLKDKFLNEFKDKIEVNALSLTEKEILDFLDKNKNS
jgi:hypothetical protein